MRKLLIGVLALLPLLAAAQNSNQPTSAPTASPPATSASTPAPPPQSAAASKPSNWPTTQFAAPAAKDPSVQKAKQILDGMIKALGGEAYLNIRDMSTEGRAYSFWQGKPSGLGTVFWRFWQWPDKDRIELTKQRDVVELNIGDKGYEITYKGTATQDPKQLDNYLRRRNHSLENVIRTWLPAQGSMILYSGTAIVERNLTDEITILNGDNDSATIAVDPYSHLPVRLTFTYRDPADRLKDDEAEIFSNYRLVQGINTPFSAVRTQNGEMRSQRFITNVTYNTGLAPTLFETKGITYNPQKSGDNTH
jgi:hypothetical protein